LRRTGEEAAALQLEIVYGINGWLQRACFVMEKMSVSQVYFIHLLRGTTSWPTKAASCPVAILTEHYFHSIS